MRLIREKCQLADTLFFDYETASQIFWNKNKNKNTWCPACWDSRAVLGNWQTPRVSSSRRWHYFPSIVVSYESKACLGGKQLSFGKLANSKCQILFQKIKKAAKLSYFFLPNEEHSLCQWSPQARCIREEMKELTEALFLKLEILQALPSSSIDAKAPVSHHHCSLIGDGLIDCAALKNSPFPNAKNPWGWTNINPE